MKRQMFAHGFLILRHRAALFAQVSTECVFEAFVRNPVSRPRECRFEAARNLMFALSAGLEERQAMANAVFDALVVASFEMQRMKIGCLSPIASIQRVLAAKTDCDSDRLLLIESQNRHDGIRKYACNRFEEIHGQVVLVTMARKSSRRHRERLVPQVVGHLMAAPGFEADPRFDDTPTLAQCFLAFVGAKGADELVEVRIGSIPPVKLAVTAA